MFYHIMTYEQRTSCLFCESTDLHSLFKEDHRIAMGCYVVEDKHSGHFMPYNVMRCAKCKSHQTKYMGDVNIIYNYAANAYGSIRGSMNQRFTEFILDNINIDNIVEIGGGNGALCDELLSRSSKIEQYTIVDPTYSGKEDKTRCVIRSFIDDVESLEVKANTLVMSHVFEHFYNPSDILRKIFEARQITYVYLSFPDLEYCVRGDSYHVLNPEHIYYVEHTFLQALFSKYGFDTKRTYYHQNHSVFFEFVRTRDYVSEIAELSNKTAGEDVSSFFGRIQKRIDHIHAQLATVPEGQDVYIWPCAMFSTFLIAMGLRTDRVKGVLDNSPHKIGKYLYGHNLRCFSFEDTVRSGKPCTVILNGGCYNVEIPTHKYPCVTFI